VSLNVQCARVTCSFCIPVTNHLFESLIAFLVVHKKTQKNPGLSGFQRQLLMSKHLAINHLFIKSFWE